MKNTIRNILKINLLFSCLVLINLSPSHSMTKASLTKKLVKQCKKWKDTSSCFQAGNLSYDNIAYKDDASLYFFKACILDHKQSCQKLKTIDMKKFSIISDFKNNLKGCIQWKNASACEKIGDFFSTNKFYLQDIKKSHYFYTKSCQINKKNCSKGQEK